MSSYVFACDGMGCFYSFLCLMSLSFVFFTLGLYITIKKCFTFFCCFSSQPMSHAPTTNWKVGHSQTNGGVRQPLKFLFVWYAFVNELCRSPLFHISYILGIDPQRQSLSLSLSFSVCGWYSSIHPIFCSPSN